MDLEVRTEGYTPESRGWLRGPHGTEPGANPSITLDLALFKANHYPDGYIKSGIVLGKVTETGFYGPYENAANDGRETARGLLFSSESVRSPEGKCVNALFHYGAADADRLPHKEGSGSLDAAARTDLTHIVWE